jgi:hypothetical protein
MITKYLSLVILIFFTASTFCQGQSRQRKKNEKITQRFAAGLVGGINVSQLDGDNYTGWNKYGLTGGIKVVTQLKSNIKLNIEFLYIDKGSKIESEVPAFITRRPKDRIIGIKFIEVPVLIKFAPVVTAPTFYMEAGLAFGKKIGSQIKENITSSTLTTFRDIESEFGSSELSSVFGFGYYLSKDLSMGARFTYGLTKFFKDPTYNPDDRLPFQPIDENRVVFLRNYALSFMISYNIF